MASKLQITYARYKAEAARLQKELAEIRTKMAVLEEAGAVDEDGQPNLALGIAPTASAESDGLPERIKTIFNFVDPDKWVSKADVIDALKSSGYVPQGKHYKVSVFKALKRLREQGKLRGRMEGNLWMFSSLER